jgi:hypothetical protein
MSVTVRAYRSGGWMVDINTRLSNGARHRERRRLSIASKSAAQRWGQDRERDVLQHGLPQPTKEVPTLEDSRRDSLKDMRMRIVRNRAASPRRK